MKMFLKAKKTGVDAIGDYDVSAKTFIVKKGSVVSAEVSNSKTFRGRTTVIKQREGNLDGQILLRDMNFKSSSTAANFVMGSSTNGLRAWKTSDGIALGDYLRQAGEIDAK